jgi:hypothetical protein
MHAWQSRTLKGILVIGLAYCITSVATGLGVARWEASGVNISPHRASQARKRTRICADAFAKTSIKC